MRGTAPLLIALGSGALLGEPLPPAVWAGVGLVSRGILSTILDARAQRHSAAATRLALLNACVIATYTTLDGLGVRPSGAAFAYSFWRSALTGAPWLIWGSIRLRRAPPRELRRWSVPLVIGGACSLISYTLALCHDAGSGSRRGRGSGNGDCVCHRVRCVRSARAGQLGTRAGRSGHRLVCAPSAVER